MKRRSIVRVHATAGIMALCLIATFFVSSLISELSGNFGWIVLVKRTVFYCMWAMLVLVPSAALTGMKLAGKSQNPIVAGKRRRMRWIAPNGLLLLTLASYLYYKANLGEIDHRFMIAQLLEFAVGFTNISLLGLMIRDGFRLKRQYQSLPKQIHKPANLGSVES